MIIIKCAKCKEKIIKYVKIGKGNIHRCYKKRIQEYYVPLENKELKCPKCGTIIGIDVGDRIKMFHNAFVCSGTRN